MANYIDVSQLADGIRAVAGAVRTAFEALDTKLYNLVTGADAFTGLDVNADAVVRKTTGVALYLRANAGSGRTIIGQTGASNRWEVYIGDSDAESGSDAGSNTAFVSLTDAGGFKAVPLKLFRQTGLVQVGSTGTANLAVGSISPGTSGVNVLAIKNGTAPASSPADGIQLYAADDAGSSEAYVRDEAGNVTKFSPHGGHMIDTAGRVTDWIHAEHNPFTGQDIEIDLFRAVELVQASSGETLIHTRDLPPGKHENPYLRRLLNQRAQLKQRMSQWQA